LKKQKKIEKSKTQKYVVKLLLSLHSGGGMLQKTLKKVEKAKKN
jgi:hypothetical protein